MKFSDNAKKGIIIALVTCAVLFVLLFSILNIEILGTAMSSILSVFTPVLIGFAIAYILNPMLRFYEFKVFKRIKKKNVIRGLSILCTYITSLLIIAILLYLLIPSIVESVFKIVSQYNDYVSVTSNWINNIINKFTASEHASEYVDEATIKSVIAQFFAVSGDAFAAVADYIVEYGMGLFVGIKNTVIGIFISIYVLISKEKLQAQVRKFGAAVFSETKQRQIGKYINLTHRTFSNFFIGQIVDACILAVITFFSLLIFRIVGDYQLALLVSFIVGVTNIIPIFGPIIGAVPSFFIIFITNPQKAFFFIILIIVLQQIDGNIIAPKILGESTGISSLGVIIAIVIMGDLFGIFGMLIGVPVFAVAITVVKEAIESKLKKKGKPIETAEYYLKDAVADPYEHHVPITKKIWNKLERVFIKTFKKNKKETPNTEENKEKKEGE